jgi:hypothetical protein
MSSLETLELEPLAMNEWMGRAACKGMVSELWDDNVPEPDALRVCFRCPVQRDCLQYGLRRAFASDAGVLGGTGVYDRQRIRAGKVTVRQVLMANLRRLVIADHGFALGIEAESLQPRLCGSSRDAPRGRPGRPQHRLRGLRRHPWGGGMRCLPCFQQRVKRNAGTEHLCVRHLPGASCYQICRCRCRECKDAKLEYAKKFR